MHTHVPTHIHTHVPTHIHSHISVVRWGPPRASWQLAAAGRRELK